MIIAIDGPSASGKSTTAKGVAEKLGITHVDTGAMYRAVTLGLKLSEISPDNDTSVCQYLSGIELYFDAKNKIHLNGVDVSHEIRSGDISSRVSAVSAIPEVREKMVIIQRRIAGEQDCVWVFVWLCVCVFVWLRGYLCICLCACLCDCVFAC